MIIQMKPRGPACIQKIRASLAEAAHLLTTPTSDGIERCAPILAGAAALLAEFEAAPYDGIHSDLQALRREIQRVAALLTQAAQLNMVWAQILGSATAGYGPTGASALSPVPRLSLEL